MKHILRPFLDGRVYWVKAPFGTHRHAQTPDIQLIGENVVGSQALLTDLPFGERYFI